LKFTSPQTLLITYIAFLRHCTVPAVDFPSLPAWYAHLAALHQSHHHYAVASLRPLKRTAVYFAGNTLFQIQGCSIPGSTSWFNQRLKYIFHFPGAHLPSVRVILVHRGYFDGFSAHCAVCGKEKKP
jgi:hypothetical protein